MGRPSPERRWWLGSLALVILIYSTLYFVRGPAEFLRERGLLVATIGFGFVAVAAPVCWLVWRRRPGVRELLVLTVLAGAFVVLVQIAKLPEEKLHFLEYGLLGGMLFEACRLRIARLGRTGLRSRIGAALLAMALAGLAGFCDEVIQGILPNRFWDVRDIVFNVAASSFVVLGMTLAAWARGRDLRA